MNFLVIKLTWENLGILVASISAISGLLEKLLKFKFIWHVIKKFFKAIKNYLAAPRIILRDLEKIKAHQSITNDKLASLENEIKYNGGKFTLKDAVKEIRVIVENLRINGHLSRETLRASMYVSSDPIYISDKEGNFTFINAAFARMVECNTPEMLLGIGYLNAIWPDDVPIVEKNLERFQKSPYSYAGPINYKNLRTGEKIKTYCRSTTVLDQEGSVVEMIGTLQIM